MYWVDTSLSTALLSETAVSKKSIADPICLITTKYKSGAILFWGRCHLIFDKIFSKNATFKLLAVANDKQICFPHFCILHIKNVWFLLELELALVTTIEMKFPMVCYVLYKHNGQL